MTRARHEPFWVLGAGAALAGAVPLLLSARIGDPALLAGAFAGWSVGLFVVATCGAVVAAASFSPGDPPRPGWLLLAGTYAVLVAGGLAMGPTPRGLYPAAEPMLAVRAIAGTLSTAAEVGALVVLGRAWRRSGLDEGSGAGRWLPRLVAVAVSVALVWRDLLGALPAALHGDLLAWAVVLSDVGDAAVFILAVPVLRAALTLGGGLVAWPWAFLTASVLGWMLCDTVAVGGEALSPRTARVLQEICKSWACAFALAAGVAQRWIMSAPPGAEEVAPRRPPAAAGPSRPA